MKQTPQPESLLLVPGQSWWARTNQRDDRSECPRGNCNLKKNSFDHSYWQHSWREDWNFTPLPITVPSWGKKMFSWKMKWKWDNTTLTKTLTCLWQTDQTGSWQKQTGCWNPETQLYQWTPAHKQDQSKQQQTLTHNSHLRITNIPISNVLRVVNSSHYPSEIHRSNSVHNDSIGGSGRC